LFAGVAGPRVKATDRSWPVDQHAVPFAERSHPMARFCNADSRVIYYVSCLTGFTRCVGGAAEFAICGWSTHTQLGVDCGVRVGKYGTVMALALGQDRKSDESREDS